MKSLPPSQPNILLVDDNRDGLLVRRTLLEELGYSVSIARNGEEGLKAFETGPFDVVVTDCKMPRMTGLELIQRIRTIEPQAKIILLSGFIESMGLTEQNTGADVVIPKSATEASTLVRCVKRLINRSASRKPAASQKRPAVSARAAIR
jgi:CheY-like chemotaxis protein